MIKVRPVFALLLVVTASVAIAQPGAPPGMPPPPPARAIPGITAPDSFPQACVSCHVNMKAQNMDVRLSTLLARLQKGEVDPKLLAAARASAADSSRIRGRHPAVTVAGRDVPASCLTCHGRTSTLAPPFARLVHVVHLGGGPSNHFLTYYQGECTHCHKLDAATGRWRIPSAPEPPGD